jgi:hypothetical protein
VDIHSGSPEYEIADAVDVPALRDHLALADLLGPRFGAATFSLGRVQALVGADDHIAVSDRERTIADSFRPRTGAGTSLSQASYSYFAALVTPE